MALISKNAISKKNVKNKIQHRIKMNVSIGKN